MNKQVISNKSDTLLSNFIEILCKLFIIRHLHKLLFLSFIVRNEEKDLDIFITEVISTFLYTNACHVSHKGRPNEIRKEM